MSVAIELICTDLHYLFQAVHPRHPVRHLLARQRRFMFDLSSVPLRSSSSPTSTVFSSSPASVRVLPRCKSSWLVVAEKKKKRLIVESVAKIVAKTRDSVAKTLALTAVKTVVKTHV